MEHSYDVVVIGCGPAGQNAALRCARAGRRVALVDERAVVGGQCLHVGTIPSKTLRAAILHASGYYERAIYGQNYRPGPVSHEDLMRRCHSVVAREVDEIHAELVNAGVHVLQGQGRLADAHTVEVLGAGEALRLGAAFIVLATGTRALIEPALPLDGVDVLSTDDILRLPRLPRSLIMLGGGVVGLEYACLFGLLDIPVQLVSRFSSLLPWVDRDLMAALRGHMEHNNVSFHLDREATGVEVQADAAGGRTVHVALDQEGPPLQADMVMVAAQRWGASRGLGLEALGIEPGARDFVPVDAKYRTSLPHIYAVGDVIGYPCLAATAIDQGRKAANHLLGMEDVPHHPLFPFGIYTVPDISMVGRSESELAQAGIDYAVGIGYYHQSARGQILGDRTGMVKLLFQRQSLDLLGAHIIGAEATELIHLAQAVMVMGRNLDYFLDTVFNYPSLAQVYKLAATDGLRRSGLLDALTCRL